MERRSFLLGTSSLLLSQLLVSCGQKNQEELSVQLLKGSIPGQIVGKFHKSLQSEVQLNFVPIEKIQEIFQHLQNWQQNPKASENKNWICYIPFWPCKKTTQSDLVTLGDYWLKTAIEQQLIQPLESEKLKQLSALDQKWQTLIKRDDQGNLHPQGKIWGAPYRWGSTVIIYNRDKFPQVNWVPQDWSDLWRPEMRDRISLLNQPREVIGLVLKKLGKSYNTDKLDQVSGLESELRTLNQQVKFYDSQNYLQPLIIGDTWLAVGWSSDVIPLLGRYPQLSVVIPQSGTAMWADLWVRPKSDHKNDLVYKWIDFCWQKEIAKQISLLTRSNSPITTNIVASDIPELLQSLLLTNPEILQRSEFLLPLSLAAQQQYESLFAKIKKGL